MPKKKLTRRTRTRRYEDELGISLNASKAGENAVVDLYRTYQRIEVPGGDTGTDSGKTDAYAKARTIARTNYWLKRYFKLKLAVYNYGLTFFGVPENAKDVTPDDASKATSQLLEWLAETTPLASATLDPNAAQQIGVASGAEVTNEERVRKFIADAWNEYLLLECLIVGWTEDQKLAYILQPESCRYLDIMGIETLFFRHGLGAQQLQLLPPKQQEIFSKPEIMFDPQEGSYFRVLKEERTGSGLGWPSVQAIFRAVSTIESMEIGESAYAFGGRMKFRHWKIGHEIKSGNMAGKPTHFWKKKIGDALRAIFSDKLGFLGDYFGNFDQNLEYPHEDVDYFDEEKWDSPEHRLIAWGGPIAEMMVADSLRPFINQMFKSEVLECRARMKLYLESVLNQAFEPPVPLRISWANTIFHDSQTQADLLKFGLSAGPLSQSTWREEAGFNDPVENAKKEQEAKDKATNEDKFKPAFDAAHGDQPEEDAGGRPAGGTNKDNQNVG